MHELKELNIRYHNIVYILEGVFNNFKPEGIPLNRTLTPACFGLMGITVVRSL